MASILPQQEREFSFSNEQFRFLAGIVTKKTGIVLSEQKRDMVYSRLVRRLRSLKLSSFAEYCDLINSDAGSGEIGNLVNAITTNLTNFFREKHHFEHLEANVIAPIQNANPSGGTIRIWSAGCSSGMEPYSIAMTVKKALPNLSAWDVKILATDIDTNMLDKGMKGEYPIEQYENIPAIYRQDVTKNPQSQTITMHDSLRKMIAFNHLNLLESWPIKSKLDAIFCRNVVIYFDKQTQSKLFGRMANLLKPDGWLYIGHSENLFKVCDRFELKGRTIYRRIN